MFFIKWITQTGLVEMLYCWIGLEWLHAGQQENSVQVNMNDALSAAKDKLIDVQKTDF